MKKLSCHWIANSLLHLKSFPISNRFTTQILGKNISHTYCLQRGVFLLPYYNVLPWVDCHHLVYAVPSEAISVFLKCLEIYYSMDYWNKFSINLAVFLLFMLRKPNFHRIIVKWLFQNFSFDKLCLIAWK